MNDLVEIQVLNKIIRTKDTSILTTNDIGSEFFDVYKDEFLFIKNHIEKYDSVPDYETVLNRFPHFEVIEVNETNNYLVQELFNNLNERHLIGTFKDLRSSLMNNEVDKGIDILKKSFDDIKEPNLLMAVDITQDVSRYDDYVQRLEDFDGFFVKTGFPELDSIINGGWDRQEELATIIARPNVGKSWILIKCAVAALEQGLRVGLYSGEMTERKVATRVDTLISHIPNGSIIHGNANIQLEYKRYIDSLPNMFSEAFKVLTPKTIGGPATVNKLRMFIEKEHLDILFVDQHSLLEDQRGASNPVEKAANISRDLKNLQVLERIPIISVSQMNRTVNESDSDSLTLAQIAQTDRIGQDSTIVIGVTRDKKDNNLLTLHLVKSRDSEVGGKLTYNVDLNRGIFQYVPDAKDATKGKGPGSENVDYRHRYESEPDGDDVF